MTELDRLAQLHELFPDLFSAGRLDWAKLRLALGAGATAEPAGYSLTWEGKRSAIAALDTPARMTLLPLVNDEADPGVGQACGSRNSIIEGDNLEVLRLLTRPYAGRVKFIYIDPPYNTGNDFIYPDSYTHAAWLSMLYPRLVLARGLLREDGAIAVSIGEEELAQLRLLLNEIFGEEHYRNTLLVRRYDKNLNRQFMERGLMRLNVGAEYVLIYARSAAFTFHPVYRPATAQRRNNGYWKGFWNAADRPTMRYALLGVTPPHGQWKWKQSVALAAVRNYEEYLAQHAAQVSLEQYWEQTGRRLKFIRRNPEGRGKNAGVEHWVPPSSGILRNSNWTDLLASGTLADLGLAFDSPKNVTLIKELLKLCCDDDDLVLDFFAGSGTTAQAVLELNRADGGTRRFILVQLPHPTGDPHYPTIAALARERSRRVIRRLRETVARAAPPACSGEDLGFRAFTLAPSQLCAEPEPWGAAPTTLLLGALQPGWTSAGVLAELALRAGFGLDCRIEALAGFAANTVYRVSDAERGLTCLLCLDDRLDLATLAALPLEPGVRFVCRADALDEAGTAAIAALEERRCRTTGS